MPSNNGSSSTVATSTPALVFGASGEQGRAVMEGLVDAGYNPVYGFTRLSVTNGGSDSTANDSNSNSGSGSGSGSGGEADLNYIRDALGCQLWKGDLGNPVDVEKALKGTKATAIFLTTTTDLPATEVGTGCWNAMEAEFEVIQIFFDTLLKVYKEDKLQRHVIFSTKDNVQQLCKNINTDSDPNLKDIVPMDDGSIVPHYSAKGRGAEYALQLLKDVPGLTLTLLTLPFVYSNFLGFFTPLPVSEDGHVNQWQISASLGDGSTPIDMMSVSDLSTIVAHILAGSDAAKKYDQVNLRLSACRISMDQIAAHFSDLFGKDVIYNPLLASEVAALPFPSAPAFAQMGQYLQHAPKHDLEATAKLLYPRRPQSFQDWLLIHSDSSAFARVNLDVDAPDITSVVVFGATSPQGLSVIKGLLKDTRKEYTVRAAVTNNDDASKEAILKELDPERVHVVHADLDDVASCQKAAEGVGGAFLVTDFYGSANQALEEQHAKNVIDACEQAHSIQHLVFSTMDNIEEMNQHFQLGLGGNNDGDTPTIMDAKAKAAAYARTKKLSVTYVILPCYSELFLDMIQRHPAPPPSPTGVDDAASNSPDGAPHKHEKLVLTVPLPNKDTKVMCMSVDDLGPAVSNIFDSYQVYAGHEIGLVTDFVTVAEICEALNQVFHDAEGGSPQVETRTMTQEDWIVHIASNHDHAYMKDLGQIFAYLSHTDAVKKRHSIARTMKLVPSARPLKQWVEQNKDNPAFREKLGLR